MGRKKKQTFFFLYIFLCIPKKQTNRDKRDYMVYNIYIYTIYTAFCNCKQHTNVIYIFCQATITTEATFKNDRKTRKKKNETKMSTMAVGGKVGAVCEGGRKASRNHWVCHVAKSQRRRWRRRRRRRWSGARSVSGLGD